MTLHPRNLLLAVTLPCLAMAAVTASPAWADAELLAVQTAKSGTLRPAKKPGVHRLVLRRSPSKVDLFTDSPGRRAGRMPVREMLATIFKPGQPLKNAALTVRGRTMSLKLRSGRYRARRKVMVYRVSPLPGTRKLPRRLRRRMHRPALFVDGYDPGANYSQRFYGDLCRGTLTNDTQYVMGALNWDPGVSGSAWYSDPSFDGPAYPSGRTSFSSQGVDYGAACGFEVSYVDWEPGWKVTVRGDSTSGKGTCTVERWVVGDQPAGGTEPLPTCKVTAVHVGPLIYATDLYEFTFELSSATPG
jgi:hypothetical protein